VLKTGFTKTYMPRNSTAHKSIGRARLFPKEKFGRQQPVPEKRLRGKKEKPARAGVPPTKNQISKEEKHEVSTERNSCSRVRKFYDIGKTGYLLSIFLSGRGTSLSSENQKTTISGDTKGKLASSLPYWAGSSLFEFFLPSRKETSND